MVYTYFQIPLMLIVFLPSLDGLRQEWYDASASLGGSAWSFWRNVGGPILAPSFLGALLLLFTNAFSAYATAQALISQGCVLITQQIACQMQSEVVLGQENVGKALALGMIVIVSVVMLRLRLDPAARLEVGQMSGSASTQLGAAAPRGRRAPRTPPKGAGAAGRRAARARRAPGPSSSSSCSGYLVLPLFAMLEFSTRGDFDKVTRTFGRSLESFAAIFSYPNLVDGIVDSLADRGA